MVLEIGATHHHPVIPDLIRDPAAVRYQQVEFSIYGGECTARFLNAATASCPGQSGSRIKSGMTGERFGEQPLDPGFRREERSEGSVTKDEGWKWETKQ